MSSKQEAPGDEEEYEYYDEEEEAEDDIKKGFMKETLEWSAFLL